MESDDPPNKVFRTRLRSGWLVSTVDVDAGYVANEGGAIAEAVDAVFGTRVGRYETAYFDEEAGDETVVVAATDDLNEARRNHARVIKELRHCGGDCGGGHNPEVQPAVAQMRERVGLD